MRRRRCVRARRMSAIATAPAPRNGIAPANASVSGADGAVPPDTGTAGRTLIVPRSNGAKYEPWVTLPVPGADGGEVDLRYVVTGRTIGDARKDEVRFAVDRVRDDLGAV